MKVYTEAIENIRDSHILYINRALLATLAGKGRGSVHGDK